MIKPILSILVIGIILGTSVPYVFAQIHDCKMILDDLAMCVAHHWNMGQIHNKGVYNSLLSKVNAAVEANDSGQINTTINILNAFINEVNAQSGKKIDSEAANHMIMHANSAISDLQNI